LFAARELSQVEVLLKPDQILGRIPQDFLGFGYEISSVAVSGLLSASNHTLVAYYRTLGPQGVVRIGGNTSDFSSWAPNGERRSAPKATITNQTSIDDLGTFLQATRWKLIWGLNLGSGTLESAVDQAIAVAESAKDQLLCFQIGNEPDLFVRSGHRRANYGYSDYHQEFSRFAAELRKRIPGVPLAGPDVAGATDWVASFAKDEGKDIKLLTEHYYRAGQMQPAATFENLLNTDPRFVAMTDQLKKDSERFGIPYRLVELNSFSGGGKPGVSDTFTAAAAGAGGINLETGVNQLGFVSSYSPIFEDQMGRFSARPSYYSMLAFSLAGRGRLFGTSVAANGANMKAYGVLSDGGQIWLTLINKDPSNAARVKVTCQQPLKSARLMRLTAPAFDSKMGVTLAGSEVSKEGAWTAKERPEIKIEGGQLGLDLPAANAALVELL
jgi:hypothetical protein